MSADNGYVIRKDIDGSYCLQMYFQSDAKYPSIRRTPQGRRFSTLDAAIAFHTQNQWDDCWSEYGLSVLVPIITEKEPKMSLDLKKFERKAFVVNGVQITEDNFEEVAAWCGGEIRTTHQDGATGADRRYIKVAVHTPLNPRQTKGFVGDWVLESKKGFKVYTGGAFLNSFREAPHLPDGVQMTVFDDMPQELLTVGDAVDAKDAIAGKR